jgi:hypothetical protein
VAQLTETRYGFKWGPITIERQCSDDKKGWVDFGLISAKAKINVYVTKTGRIRLFDEHNDKEYKLC